MNEPYPEYAKKCSRCGHDKIQKIVKEYIDGYEAEVSYVCGNCKNEVAYWAYGYFDPHYDPTINQIKKKLRKI